VFEKQNITVFDVITFHINGRMITEVYPCIIFHTKYVVLYRHFKIVFSAMLLITESHMYACIMLIFYVI
jgi:hypothetical protein